MAEGGEYHNSDVADVTPTSLSPGTSGSAVLAEGENVNLSLTKSSVNVVSGNQTNVLYNITGAKKEASGTISNAELIQICNENTMNVTAIDILDDFRHEYLQHPDFEVYPQMREVDVDDYYKGRYGHTQLTQEVGFLRKDRIGGRNIGIDDVVASLWQREKLGSSKTVGITAIVASAGSGKSTLTRRIARHALCISSASDVVKELSSYDVKMVHYIELKDVQSSGKIKPSKFLFGGLYRYEEEEEQAFEWLDNHQGMATLIFDGLDQVTWDFNAENIRKIRKHDKASCWTVMYNILSRKILPQAKIYISSREFKVSELPAMARPETIITLNGFTLEDAHRLFAFLLEERGEELWQKIEVMSPRLLNLVSVPVFLILTAVVMGRDPTRPPPATVTELYHRIILALQSVENIRNRMQILSIINKLKALAFQGTKEGRVVFKETDLGQFGVSAVEVQDLMTKVPGNNLLSRHLMQGDFTFFFSHQSIQEYLAAVFVAEMELNEFYRFGKKHLHEERWCVVRRFVSGVVFSKSHNDLKEESDQTKKRHVLARSILSQLQEDTNERVRMEAYTAIYESDDDCLMKELSVIDVSHNSLSRDEAHVVGSLAARNGSLRSFILAGCHIDDELLCIISRCMRNLIHVKEVDLRGNNFSETALRSLLGHRRIESLSGNLDWEIVRLTSDGYDYELKNEGDVIQICNLDAGQFNMKKSTLSFQRIHSLGYVAYLGHLFDAEFIELNAQQHLLVKQKDLLKISDVKIEKISKILLDCTEENCVDWSLIETSSKKYQTELLDIALNGNIPVDDYNRILEIQKKISGFHCPVNIHAMFNVTRGDDFGRIVEFCRQLKVEYARCIFSFGCCVPPDQISALVNNSNLKKLTLIYRCDGDMLRGDELKNVWKIANDLDTELEVLWLFREVSDAWDQLDQQVSMGPEQEEPQSSTVKKRFKTRKNTPPLSKSVTDEGMPTTPLSQIDTSQESGTTESDAIIEEPATTENYQNAPRASLPLAQLQNLQINVQQRDAAAEVVVQESMVGLMHLHGQMRLDVSKDYHEGMPSNHNSRSSSPSDEAQPSQLGNMSSSQMTSTSSTYDRQQPHGAAGPRNKGHGQSSISKYIGKKQPQCLPSTQTSEISNCKKGGSTESDATKEMPTTCVHYTNPHHQSMASTHSWNNDQTGGVSPQKSDPTREVRPRLKSHRRKLEEEDRLLINKQIYFDLDLHFIHCYLWIGDDKKEYCKKYLKLGYKEKYIAPKQIFVNKRDKLTISCNNTTEGQSYCIKYAVRGVDLEILESSGYWLGDFRIDPAPHEIQEPFIDIDCFLYRGDISQLRYRNQYASDGMNSKVSTNRNDSNTDSESMPSTHSRNGDRTDGVVSLQSDAAREAWSESESHRMKPGEAGKMKIKNQVFRKQDTLHIHCHFWISDGYEDEYHSRWFTVTEGYERCNVIPKIIYATLKDDIYICFEKSDSNASYYIRNDRWKVDLSSLNKHDCLECIFRIDPGPDQIEEDDIDFSYRVKKNTIFTQEPIPIRFERKKDSRAKDSKQKGRSKNKSLITIIYDKTIIQKLNTGTYKEENDGCVNYLAGEFRNNKEELGSRPCSSSQSYRARPISPVRINPQKDKLRSQSASPSEVKKRTSSKKRSSIFSKLFGRKSTSQRKTVLEDTRKVVEELLQSDSVSEDTDFASKSSASEDCPSHASENQRPRGASRGK